MPDSLSRTLARFVDNLQFDNLPPEVPDKVKASLIHSLIGAFLGAQTGHGKASIDLVKLEESRADGATILADGARATRCGAAFANSKLMHATNQSDSYRMLLHPGPCVIPAALATAQLERRAGRELVAAIAAGYEVEARIAGDYIPSTQARGFRSSPVYGTLGAAVATGKLLRLNVDQLVTTIALACTFAAGTTEGPRSGGREMLFHEPNATRNGIMAALLAGEQVKGSETALEGAAGFYNAFTGNNRGDLSYVFGGPDHVSLDSVVSNLGERWELLHVTPKLYPTAGYNCPVIELMTDIRASHNLPIEEIEKITVDMNWLETTYPSPAFPNPERSADAPSVGSTHYFTAYTCVKGHYPPLRSRIEPGAQSSEDENPVLELMKKVEVIGHKDRKAFAPRITVSLAGGTEYQGEYQGNELEWNFATELRRVRPLFDDMPWPRDNLESIAQIVSGIEIEQRMDHLIAQCVSLD